MSELLPCPFCGGEAQRTEVPAEDDSYHAGASYIECRRCCATSGLHFDRKENLLDSWNRREPHFPEQELLDLRQSFEVMQASEVLWRQTDRALRDEIGRHQTNVRHWREECGKLHAQLAKAKADLRAWEITAKRIEEAERPKDVECQTCEGSGEIFHGGGGPDDPERCHICTGTGIVQRYLDDGSCLRCGAAPRNASGLCATCVDEDAVRAGEIPDLAGVAEQSGAGAPETSVRCGAPAAPPVESKSEVGG